MSERFCVICEHFPDNLHSMDCWRCTNDPTISVYSLDAKKLKEILSDEITYENFKRNYQSCSLPDI